jgi:hypothetical protein
MRRAFASCSSRQGRVRVLVYAATAVLLWALGSTHAQISPPVDPALSPAFKEAAAKPTPRTPDGHPDLTGYWTTGAAGGVFGAVHVGSAAPLGQAQLSADGKTLDLGIENERDICIQNVKDAKKRWEAAKLLRPSYKPQYQATVEGNFNRQQFLDPAFRCQAEGVPRVGVPREIVQTPKVLYFFYVQYENNNVFRTIPTDGRSHNKDADAMAMGDSVGHWEEDTLVVDVTNLSEDTWLTKDGDIHSSAMHVIERFTRQGNILHYAVTVEDPEMLTKPWSPKPSTMILGQPAEHIGENYPCSERSTPHLANDDHH